MRKWFKRGISFFLMPLARWYLMKERNYHYQGFSISVLAGVFHPGLFSSTKIILDFLRHQQLKNSTLLELGCGTGLISIVAEKAGADVTASDLSLAAIKNASHNIRENGANIKLIHSDLFENIGKCKFDWIIINPPYYAKSVVKEEELAWHCGKDFQYFHQLFYSLPDFMHSKTRVIMVLTLGCELDKIFKIAEGKGFYRELLKEKNVLFDGKVFLDRLRLKDSE